MRVEPTTLPGVLTVEPRVFADARGAFFESYVLERYAEAGIDVAFVQDNVSVSARDTLRGLHLQHPRGQAKLVQVLEGEVFDVAVDVRPDSPHFRKYTTATLSGENHRQLFIPGGFAHGFCVLSERAVLSYKCSAYYDPQSELGVRWDDPTIGIDWPVTSPLLSERDRSAPLLSDIDPARLPRHG
ncbi:MAG: dTDP-4-dehydrorhamnose 3,5-epimerase [Myxococcales bacterium]|nr:dTDP-4-dehydrorhamnose 3,5-epimerase [Myxococcales bacterium]